MTPAFLLCVTVKIFSCLQPSTSCRRSLNWHTLCAKVNLNPGSRWWRCSLQQSFAADFDQVSSFGLSATFPDDIACCGNRNLKVSGDRRAALSVHTWLRFYIWPPQTCDFLFLCLSADWQLDFNILYEEKLKLKHIIFGKMFCLLCHMM